MANQIDLKGRNAVVTGGAQGIGYAVAERLMASGARVALWDRDQALAEKAAASLSQNGSAIAVIVDQSNPAQVEAAAQQTLAAFGTIDILVAEGDLSVGGEELSRNSPANTAGGATDNGNHVPQKGPSSLSR
jgi:3-oxoacyl-[acyl-carrier protein] reductase